MLETVQTLRILFGSFAGEREHERASQSTIERNTIGEAQIVEDNAMPIDVDAPIVNKQEIGNVHDSNEPVMHTDETVNEAKACPKKRKKSKALQPKAKKVRKSTNNERPKRSSNQKK